MTREETFKLKLAPWEDDLLWNIVDILRTSEINPHYPYGFDCKICEKAGIECHYDSDGKDCNWAYIKYFKEKLKERGIEKPKSCSTCRSYKGHAGHCEICHEMSMYKEKKGG